MSTISIYSLLFLGAFLISIVLFIIVIVNELHSAKLLKRFDDFTLKYNDEHEVSFFDQFSYYLEKWIKKIAKILKKSKVCNDYAKSYDKYIEYDEKEKKESIDYITIKFLIGIAFVLLNLFTMMLKVNKLNPISCLFTFLLGFFLPDIALKIEFQKKRKEIESGLLKAIIIMNNSFKSGKNIMQAISTVKSELDGPIADEFKKIYLDITYGLSLEVVFNRFYERVKLEDAKYIASSLTLLNKTGGNIVHVFATIEKSFFNKKRMVDELNSLTASSQFVFRVLTILPIVFTLVILILNPTYFMPLFQSAFGFFFLFLILCLYIFYILTIKKVMKVKM